MTKVVGPSKGVDYGGEGEDGGVWERGEDRGEMWKREEMGVESEERSGELGVGEEVEFEEVCVYGTRVEESGSWRVETLGYNGLEHWNETVFDFVLNNDEC